MKYITKHYPSLHTTSLPPLSKGGGLTARHKLLLHCVCLQYIRLFYSPNFSAVKTEGLLPIPTINEIFRTIPITKLASLVKGEVLSPEKIRATTGGIALHPPSLSIPTTFSKTHQPLRPAPCPCLPSKKGRWHGCRGFSACCTVFR